MNGMPRKVTLQLNYNVKYEIRIFNGTITSICFLYATERKRRRQVACEISYHKDEY